MVSLSGQLLSPIGPGSKDELLPAPVDEVFLSKKKPQFNNQRCYNQRKYF
jgi:hypothetical protein